MKVPLLNFQGGPGVRLLNFRGLPSPILNFVGGVQGPGSQSSEAPCPGSWSHFYTMPSR